VDFPQSLLSGTLVKRYQRFKADIVLDEGNKLVTAHCPNTGSMLGLNHPGTRVYISYCPNIKRSLAYTWELVQEKDTLIGVNTQTPNKLFKEAFHQGHFDFLKDYPDIKTEVKMGNSRIDFMLIPASTQNPPLYLEVKNVHYKKDSTAFFPDSVTQRGAKHMALLSDLVEKGFHAMVFYMIQRNDVENFQVADFIDTEYGLSWKKATNIGVKSKAFTCHISPEKICVDKEIPIIQ
jgi:sugar fermentation stimulation protein A